MTQLHFHVESENMLHGHHKDMEIHMVHQSDDGHSLVLGSFVQSHHAVSEQNKFLDELLELHFVSKNLSTGLLMNPYAGALKEDQAFFSFLGSLTTPPCTPNLEWVLMRDPIWVAPEDVARLERYLKQSADQADSYGRDDRPVQPLNGRPILVGRISKIA